MHAHMRLAASLAVLLSFVSISSKAVETAVKIEPSKPVENAAPLETAKKKIRLSDVKVVYVAPLGSDTNSELIRQKLINRLIKDGTFEVVETPETADAILKGAAEVDKRHYLFTTGTAISGGTKVSAQGAFRLVSKGGQVIWLDEVNSRKLFTLKRSVSGILADKIVSRLKTAVEADKTSLASQPFAATK